MKRGTLDWPATTRLSGFRTPLLYPLAAELCLTLGSRMPRFEVTAHIRGWCSTALTAAPTGA